MKKYTIRPCLLLILALVSTHAAMAQSSTLDNGYRTSAVGDVTFEFAETLYIGPDAVWEINGTHVVYSTNIWIAPTAQISGTGTLIIADPSTNPFYTVAHAPTIIDGNNGNLINLNIEHQNPANIILDDIADPGFGTINPSGAFAAALKIGKDFSFEVDNGDVLLNGNDFVFREPATVSNFGVNRMVVTDNSIEGHMVMQFNEGPSGSFTFPVGIAEGNYTPATLGSYGIVDFNVSVTDYSATSAVIQNPQEGMDRVWHIYGSGSPSSMELQHNTSTNGTSYIDEQAYITRYNGSQWQPSDRVDYISAGVHRFTINSSEMLYDFGVPFFATSDQAWFTKTSDKTSPLPVILVRFEAKRVESRAAIAWSTSSESHASHFEIQRSADGSHFETVGRITAFGDGNELQNYSFLDEPEFLSIVYYRLKMVDTDNTFAFSGIRKVSFEDVLFEQVSIYPNPASAVVQVDAPGAQSLKIFNSAGQNVYTSRQVAPETVAINNLPAGVYTIQIVLRSGSVKTARIVVVR